MAKTSSKKKGAAKKKSASKVKSSPKAKKTTTAKGAADSKATAGKTPPKKVKKKATMKDLLLKKFDAWQPDALYAPPKADVEVAAAPPIAAGENAGRVKALLMKTFEPGTEPTGKEAPAIKKTTAPAEKTAEKTAAKAPAKKVPAKPPKKETAAKASVTQKPVSIRELLSRRFDEWVPTAHFAPPPQQSEAPPAPPIAAGADADRVKALLLKRFDLPETAEAPVQPPESKSEAPTPATEPISIDELLHRRFDTWRPEKRYAPPQRSTGEFSAPPIAVGEEAERIKGLLFRQFDLSDMPLPAASAVEPQPAVPTSETTVPEEVKASEEVAVQEVKSEVAAQVRETAGKVIRPDPVYRPEDESESIGPSEKEKTEAQVPPISPQKKGSDPMESSMKFLAACAIVLLAIMIGVSFSNASNYYLRSTGDSLEIWKGSFAPLGEERVVRLSGVEAPESIQGVFAREQVMPIAFHYYMDKANDLLYSQGVASYEEVQDYINEALKYADAQNAKRAFAMQKNMRILSMMTMADVAASKANAEGYQLAIEYMEKAAQMDNNDLIDMGRTRHAPIIEKKMAAYKELLSVAAPESETEEAAETE